MKKDTAVYYYKNVYGDEYKNCAPDTCDFFRLIITPDPGKKLWDVMDYYRSGKVKLIAKADFKAIKWSTGVIGYFDEQYISYYENGNRERIITFNNGAANAYEYYPNGKMFCSILDIYREQFIRLQDCFNNKGEAICEKGNGQWIKYDESYNNIIAQGRVKNGLREGEWHATLFWPDSINATIQYKKGVLISGISYDKKKNLFSCKNYQEILTYDDGWFFDFFNDVKSNFKPPRDPNGKKMTLDTTIISFVVGYDGKLSDVKVLDKVEPKFANAIIDAIAKCKTWSCRKYLGVPFRSRLTLSFQYYQDGKVHEGLNFRRDLAVHYDEDILARE